MKNIKYCFLSICVLLLMDCGGNNGGSEEEVINPPSKASLVYPDNNQECTGGVVISNTEAEIEFDWNEAANTTSYILYITNLNTNVTTNYNSTTDDKEVTIERGTPYSWYVVSKSNETETNATSDTWKFYLAGTGVTSYAPFPADLKTPDNDVSVSTTSSVTLTWEGADVDNDVKEYEIYLDTNSSPTTKVATVTTETHDQSVLANTTYYWKVVTIDDSGNTSTSQVYKFSVL